MSQDEFWGNLGKPSPIEPGTRIRLISMPDDPDPIPSGTCGIVESGNGAQLNVRWENGRTLHLLVGIDRYEVV